MEKGNFYTEIAINNDMLEQLYVPKSDLKALVEEMRHIRGELRGRAGSYEYDLTLGALIEKAEQLLEDK